MKTIKIIELLNKIANGEEKPKRIKWGEHYFEWFVYEYKATKELGEPLFSQLGGFGKHFLTDEVEILDEEDEFEDIEEMNLDVDCTCEWNFGEVYDTINQLIKNQKKIIERLKENE